MITPHGDSRSGAPRRTLVTVLLIEEDQEEASRVERVFESEVPDARIICAGRLDDARRILARCMADLIVTNHDLADGTCGDVLALAEEGPEVVPVFAYVRGDRVVAEHVRQEYPRLLDCAASEHDGGHVARTPAQYLLAVARVKRAARSNGSGRSPEVLRRVRHTITRVNHDLNNPLSIISGNAQLLVELARALELDGDLSQPIHDIEEASARVSGILRRLVDLKDQLPVDEAIAGDVRAELRELQANQHDDR